MDLNEFFDYKNLLMEQLCSNPEIVRMITGNKDARVPNHGLPYSQIFPYEFIPETVSTGKTFVCFDVDIDSVQSKTSYTPVLYVWVFTHKSNLRNPEGGCLLDSLSVLINKVLNGSRYYGLGALRLHSVRRFSPITDYLGRVLTYYAKDFNLDIQKPDIPSNRKEE